MKIIVRKMPNMILDKTFNQIEGLYETCFNGDAMETFLKSVEMSQGQDCLNLEDDIILCNNFLNEINNVIKKYPDKVISFFTLKKVDTTTEMSGRTFCMAQCMYLPSWINNLLYTYYDKWKNTKRGIENPTGLDLMIADLLSEKKQTYILSLPCLVQHMEMKSRIDPRRSTKRQTKYFKDDIE